MAEVSGQKREDIKLRAEELMKSGMSPAEVEGVLSTEFSLTEEEVRTILNLLE